MRAVFAAVIALALILLTGSTLVSPTAHDAASVYTNMATVAGFSGTGTNSAELDTYPLTFTESGLPSGTNWSVSLNDTTRSAALPTITIAEPNGTYQLYTWDVKGYTSYSNVTTLKVSGAPMDITVYYTPPPAGFYFVTFVQTGLSFNVVWEVQLSAIINGTTEPGGFGQNYFGPTHTPSAPYGVENGTFAWTAFHPSVPEYPIPTYFPFPSSGTVVVNGSSVLIDLAYRYSYPFYFDVEGLPTTVPLTLQILNETTTGSGSAEYLLMIPNGTFEWNATAPGYQPQNGTISIQGMPEFNVKGISFEALPSATNPPWAWVEIGVVIAAIGVGAAAFLLRWRKGGGRMREGQSTPIASTPPPSQQPPSPP
ncbi:MAG: hypothetical protein WA691_05930 [Thermoplasmata archaeon]